MSSRALLRCPRCAGTLDDDLACTGCRARAQVDDVAIDFVGEAGAPESLGARAMRSRGLARIYERWWRPAVFGLTTGFRMPAARDEAVLVMSKIAPTSGPWLDLSCGPGHLTRHLVALAGERAVVAVDLSRAMLERARVNAPAALRVRADAGALPLSSGAFGAVVNLAALDLYPDAGRVVAESARVLAAGGRWVASSFVTSRSGAARRVWTAVAGVRTPHEGDLARHAGRAGLVGYGEERFGRYLVAWADKP